MLMHSKRINMAIRVFEIAHAISCDQVVNFVAENYVFVIFYPIIPNLTFLVPIMSQK